MASRAPRSSCPTCRAPRYVGGLLITAVDGLGVIRSVSMSRIYKALFRASILSAVFSRFNFAAALG